MRIALVSPYDWAVPGGVNRHVSSLALNFLRRGHEPEIIAPSSKPLASGTHHVRVIGESVIGLPASGSVANVCLSYDLGPKVSRLLKRERYDIVHIHEPFMPLLPFQFLRFSTTTNVATFHATRDGGSRVYSYTKFLIHPYWQNLHSLICVSRASLRMISRSFADRYQIIPNGIDYGFFAAEAPPMPDLMDHRRNILFVGRQEKRKGLPYLLEAYRQLKAEMPDTRLIIVGPDGGIRGACQRYVEQHQLKDVHFIGYVSDQDLPRYYRSADVFCAPNTGHESFGIILLEAMAASKPIVASDISGFRDVLTHEKHGLLVPPKDASALAIALKTLLSDPDRRDEMARAGSDHARQFAWDEVSAKVLSHYERTLANGNGLRGA
ncbi:MAG: glycosyltransferase family 4 protein [Chloroflexi bacterium]|nr:glycosyltransferase family 4 protein [Chloroflexota bacterium]